MFLFTVPRACRVSFDTSKRAATRRAKCERTHITNAHGSLCTLLRMCVRVCRRCPVAVGTSLFSCDSFDRSSRAFSCSVLIRPVLKVCGDAVRPTNCAQLFRRTRARPPRPFPRLLVHVAHTASRSWKRARNAFQGCSGIFQETTRSVHRSVETRRNISRLFATR